MRRKPGLPEMTRKRALKVLGQEDGHLPKAVMLRCRVRYFTDGAILGSAEFVRGFTGAWQMERGRKHRPQVNTMQGGDWGDLTVIQGLRRQVFG
jgi:putative transposase